jgi:cell division protein FtsQ
MRPIVIKIIIIVLIIVGIFAIGFQFKNAQAFNIDTIKINGDYSHISEDALESAITPFVQQSTFFNMDTQKINESLLQLPWIDHVEIRRDFPSSINVTLYEKKPVAIWNSKNLITADDVVFSPALSTFPNDLPKINAPENQSMVALDMFLKVDTLLKSFNLSIEQLNVSERHVWEFQLNNGIKIIVGNEQSLDRVKRFMMVYNKVIGDKYEQVISVDLRYQSGFSIQWKK